MFAFSRVCVMDLENQSVTVIELHGRNPDIVLTTGFSQSTVYDAVKLYKEIVESAALQPESLVAAQNRPAEDSSRKNRRLKSLLNLGDSLCRDLRLWEDTAEYVSAGALRPS